MQQTEFETIRERDSNDEAETVTVAILHALGTRIWRQFKAVAEQLPDELAGVLSVENERTTVTDEAEATASALDTRAPISSESRLRARRTHSSEADG